MYVTPWRTSNTLDGSPLVASYNQEGSDTLQPSLEIPGWKVLQPPLLLFPRETLQLPSILWSSTNGTLPSVAIPTTPAQSHWMELLKASTNAATSKLLRTWAIRVHEFLKTPQAPLPTGGDHATPAAVPCSAFQATLSLVVLAEYLALSLCPTAMAYNDVGILLSSIANHPRIATSSGSSSTNEITGHSLSKLYFEAGLEVVPRNACLLTNLGSYWKKERNHEEAIRFVTPALRTS